MTFHLALSTAAALIAFHFDAALPSVRPTVSDAGGAPVTLPSFDQVPETPALEQPGVKVRLGKTRFRTDEPIAVHGIFVADGAVLAQTKDDPLGHIVVIAIGRTIPGVWHGPVRRPPNLAPVPSRPGPRPKPSFRRTGFFNLDVRQHLHLPAGAGSYWLLVAMADQLTEPLEIVVE